MNKKIAISGVILGVFAVILGAFAAHGLKKLITADALLSFETGVKYQMYHAFLLLFVSLSSLSETQKKRLLVVVMTGVLLFSGSIYALATNTLTEFDFKTIALITPFGGLTLITGWILLGVYLYKYSKEKNGV